MKRSALALVVALSLTTATCAHVQPVVSCLEKLAGPALNAVVAEIYETIESGLANEQVESAILASLARLAVKFAPDVWACAMHFVASPDVGPNELKALTPANGAAVAAVAADYLAETGAK